jgi:hypothetical protein
VASKKTLNPKNLEALGAQRLAELLIEVGNANAAVKRRIRLELAGAQSPGEVANELRKRLTTIARSRSFIDWQNRRTLIEDLETQRHAIVNQVAKADATEALELIWRFMALANTVFERCDDSSGTVIGVFHAAVRDLGAIAQAAKVAPEVLVERAFNALNENDYGQYDELIRVLCPALGPTGLEQLKGRFLEMSTVSPEKPKDKDRKVIGWGSGGPLYADEIASRRYEGTIRLALQKIADAQGDVDAFIAQQSKNARAVPTVAAEIARRLLGAGRAEEAWNAINAVDENRSGWIPFEWEEVRLDVMEALGRKDEAQAFRWQCFERALNSAHLRAYLKRLPDFDDVEAENKALDLVAQHPKVHAALAFLVEWPAQERAAQLVQLRFKEIDGDRYELLDPAAVIIEGKYPLAAVLLRRALIEVTLQKGRATRYKHAARHVREIDSLNAQIKDYESFETHQQFMARLLKTHPRKSGFWQLLRN